MTITRTEYWTAQCDGCKKSFQCGAADRYTLINQLAAKEWRMEDEKLACPECCKIIDAFAPQGESSNALD